MKEKILAVFFTLMAIWVQGALLFQNGLFDKKGNLVFYDIAAFRDVTVHLSLVQEILNRFPPTNFAAAGLPLKNYHYFFDVGAAVLTKILPLQPIDTYFRVIPVILSGLLCLTIYLVTRRLSKSRLAAALAIFFTIFATSFGPAMPFLADFFHWSHITGSGNTFMMDQLFGMMVNPQGILSIIIFLALFLFFDWYEKTKKIISLILIVFLLGISFGVKAYGGILFAPAAILASFYLFIKNKDYKPVIAVFFGVFLMGLWFLYSIDSKVAGMSFAPFWILTHMMSDINRLDQPMFAVLPANVFKAFAVIIFEFFVFLFGALGLRIFGWMEIFRERISAVIFLYATAIFSLFLPLFFNQSSKAYEVLQFFPYFTVVTGILFSIWVSRKHWLIILLFALLFLAFDKQELDVRIKGSSEKIMIPASELAAVNYVRQNTDPAAVFMLAPSGFNADYLWFTALSGRRVVYAGSRFEQQIGVDPAKITQKYDYIFVSEKLDGGSARISDQANLKLVFEKDGARVYRHD